MEERGKEDGVLKVLDGLKRGIEFTGWSGGKEYQDYLLSLVDALIEINTACSLVPKIEGLIKSEADVFIRETLGFEGLSDKEWKVFAAKMFCYADWPEAMTRAFWEEVLPMRLGPGANINQHYLHTYEHCDCEWECRGYVVHDAKCPICGEQLTAIKSVPVPNKG